MKKLAMFIISISIILTALSSCANNNPASPANTPTITPTATPYLSATATCTFTITLTHTNSPTITETPTISETRTVSPTMTATRTNTPVPAVTVAVYSNEALDGYITSGGGYQDAGNATYVGDDYYDDMCQSLLSFTLPAVSNVTQAILRVNLETTLGTPLALSGGGAVNVSHVTPNYTVAGANLPYLAPGSNTSIGIICDSETPGWYTLDVTAAVQDDISNARAASQFRLYMYGTTDNDATYDIFGFYTGESSFKPELIIYHGN